jgi:orotate phosphoribosyltransferase
VTPTPTRDRLRSLLLDLSFEWRPVVLASGQKSDFYLDCKQTALHPEGAAALGALLLDATERLEAGLGRKAAGAGGMSIGADPLATAVSLAAWGRGRHLPAFLVRKERKAHGTGAWVEGRRNLPDGSPVILLEDVVTTGGSTLRAAERVREDGLEPIGVAAIVDRLSGGAEAFAAAGLAFEALFRIDELLASRPK